MAKKTKGEGWVLISAQSQKPAAAKAQSRSPAEHKLKILFEGRAKGKGVTIIKDFSVSAAELKDLASQLKAACGVGGKLGEDFIELQGDVRDKAKAWLESRAWGLR